jgi:hypothetical protein
MFGSRFYRRVRKVRYEKIEILLDLGDHCVLCGLKYINDLEIILKTKISQIQQDFYRMTFGESVDGNISL